MDLINVKNSNFDVKGYKQQFGNSCSKKTTLSQSKVLGNDKFESGDKKISKIVLYSTLAATLAIGIASFIKGKPTDDIEKGFFKRIKDGFLDLVGVNKAKKISSEVEKFNSEYKNKIKNIDGQLKSIEDLTESECAFGMKLADMGKETDIKSIDLYVSEVLKQKEIKFTYESNVIEWKEDNFNCTYRFEDGFETLTKKNKDTEIVLHFDNNNKFDIIYILEVMICYMLYYVLW